MALPDTIILLIKRLSYNHWGQDPRAPPAYTLVFWQRHELPQRARLGCKGNLSHFKRHKTLLGKGKSDIVMELVVKGNQESV